MCSTINCKYFVKANALAAKMQVMDSTDTMNTERLSKNDSTKEDNLNNTDDESLVSFTNY